jgi:CYTH domain-containing protein
LGLEIERKYLVKNKNYKKLKIENKNRIEQGYITLDKEKLIRIRIASRDAFLTIKGLATKITRHEYEYQIPVKEAREMLELFCYQPIIKKVRYAIKYQGKVWEIDEFEGLNRGLTIAEIELENEDEKFDKPDFIGQEVTDDPRYYNFNLVKNPYKEWEASG